MKLNNPFPFEVRKLYLDCWECFLCHSNGTNRGGLSIHHIMGRNSDSAFNSSCLCGICHEGMCHSQEEEQQLFLLTLKYLYNLSYEPIQNDYDFIKENYNRLITEDTLLWLKKL